MICFPRLETKELLGTGEMKPFQFTSSENSNDNPYIFSTHF